MVCLLSRTDATTAPGMDGGVPISYCGIVRQQGLCARAHGRPDSTGVSDASEQRNRVAEKTGWMESGFLMAFRCLRPRYMTGSFSRGWIKVSD